MCVDFVHGKGNSGESIYGPVFEGSFPERYSHFYSIQMPCCSLVRTDESFAVAHDRRGVVGSASHGRHTNNSQFYITLHPAPAMDHQFVAFGCAHTLCPRNTSTCIYYVSRLSASQHLWKPFCIKTMNRQVVEGWDTLVAIENQDTLYERFLHVRYPLSRVNGHSNAHE